MTLSEFKAWFEGFTEGMDAAPDEKQWDRIKARVKDIDGVAVTRTVFVDRYVTPYRPYWTGLDVFGATAIGSGNTSFVAGKSVGETFESHNAMLDLGKAEYSAALSPRSIC
jgi:hypothetical protein